MEKNLTTGSVFKNLIFFSLPFFLSYFLQTLYGMADLFIIGRFEDAAATTAVSVGSQLMHMLTVMIVGLTMGATVGVGRAVGCGDRKAAGRFAGNTVTVFAGISAVLTVGLFLAVRPIAALLQTPAQAFEGTVLYLRVCFAGIPFITAYNVIASLYRGQGDSRSPMIFIAAACLFNIGLDYLFMGAFHMGPLGAALGTTISQGLSVAVALIFMKFGKTGIPVTRDDFRPDRTTVARIFGVGAPIALQDGLIQVAFIFITVIANRRGLYDSAAVGIVEKIISFLFLVPSSMLSATSALGAQNIGAGKPARARQTLGFAVLIAAGFGIFVAVLFQFCAQGAVSLFTDAGKEGGAAVIRLGGEYLRGYIFDCIFAGIHFSFSGYFCACGRSGLSFLHNVIAVFLVRVPAVYLASRAFPDTLFPMGLATATGSLLSVLLCIFFFFLLTGKEKTKAV